MKREFLMLAHTLKHHLEISEWWYSEKLDGVRAFWDGGITRGMPKERVPWGNIMRDKQAHVSTGLWSRYGNVIHAPDDWLDKLPAIPLDGELWMGEKSRQRLMSIVKRLVPDRWDWQAVEYKVFDSPPPATIFAPGRLAWGGINCSKWIAEMVKKLDWYRPASLEYVACYRKLRKYMVEQRSGGNHEEYLEEIISRGGEGIMFRDPLGVYECGRSHKLLKWKPYYDMEVTVVGSGPGKGKYEGMMGSLLCKCPNGRLVNVSGFTDEERSFPISFTLGDTITIKYRELSVEGVPVEARYWRKYYAH